MMVILAILAGVLDLACLPLAIFKYWRISCGLLGGASALVFICWLASSPAIAWIVGYHVFFLIVTLAIVWEQKRGQLKD